MQRPLTRTGMAGAIAALAVASVLGSSLVAYADNIQSTIYDSVSGALVLEAGSGTAGTGGIRVIHTGGDGDPNCNIDANEPPLLLDIITPPGITASPDPLTITDCSTTFTPVHFTASSAAESGTVTAAILSSPEGYDNKVNIPITVTRSNAKPTVTVQGAATGTYEIGSAPTPTCAVTDTEDGPSSFPAAITGTLTHGLGTLTATCDYTDEGGLKATTASVTYTIADTGAPTITHTITGTGPNANGWYRSQVGIAFTCADGGGSGIQYCGENALFGDGANQSVTGTATDWAGNSAQDVVSDIDVDATAPGIFSVLTPAAPDGTNGWYLGPVDVDFQCDDALSGIESCAGDTTIDEGIDGASGSALDKAGNTAESSVSGVKVDAGAPTIGYRLISESALVNGWFNKPVTVEFDCEDAVSGIATCEGDTELTEGVNQSATGTATDLAGHVSTTRTSDIDIDIDTTAPGISAKLSPSAPDGTNGWYVTTVGVQFECDDALSGIDTCPAGTTIGEGAAGGASGTAIDVAGNTATASVSGIKVDTSAPTLGYSLIAGEPVNGWFTGPVTVHFTCADAGSGIVSCPDDVVLGDGADQSVTRTTTDAAGHVTTRTIDDIDVDGTAPTVAFAAGFGSTYHYGAVPAAPACQASDAVSGLASCVVTGGGSSVGTHTLTATATDRAGNVATATLTYEVLPWSLKGFFSPVDMGSVLNTVKGGSTVPLKFEVFAAGTELTATSAVKSFTTTYVACDDTNFATDEIEITVTGGTALRYDATSGQYIQNWATPKKPGACMRVTMTTQDDSALVAYFKLK